MNICSWFKKKKTTTPTKVPSSMKSLKPDGEVCKLIDISHHNGLVDFKVLMGEDIVGVYAKATEGLKFSDSMYQKNKAQAIESGMPFGPYHFYHHNENPLNQADRFFLVAGVTTLPYCMDWEDTGKLPTPGHKERALLFLERVEELTGKQPIIYTGLYYARDVLALDERFAKYLAWFPDYSGGDACRVVHPWDKWMMWQYTEHGKTDASASGGIDLNYFNGDIKKFRETFTL